MAGATFTSTGSFSDVLKNVYEPLMRDLSVTESELWDLFTEQEGFAVQEGPDGKGIYIDHMFHSGGGVGWVSESDYVPASQDPSIKQSSITIKQASAVVEMSGRVMRRVKEGPAAFTTWADTVLKERVKRLAFHKDVALMGAGTGIYFQVNMATPASTALAINNAFGISGLEGAFNLIYGGDGIRIAADAAGATLRSGAAVVQKLSYGASTIDIDALPTATANGDYISLGDANQNSFGKSPMGLLGIVDDGTVVSTFQNLSRSTYQQMQAQIVDSTTALGATFGGQFSEDLLEYAERVAEERGMGRPDVIVCNRSASAAFWKDLKNDRRINDPAGVYQGGVDRDELKVRLGSRVLTLKNVRKCPSSRAFLVEKDTLRMYRVGPGRWDDTTGSIWNRSIDSTGRKDAYWASFVEEYEVACDRPNHNVQITKLVAA